MARPPKLQRVDYFPHMCIHNGKTLFILEQRYKEKGYTFWFKLLEKLGSTTGHALDLSDAAEWELFQVRSYCDESLCDEIMALLVRLDAIDGELWSTRRVVWCQNFVDNIADVYHKRNCAVPLKPGVSGPETTGEAGFPDQKHGQGWVSVTESAARIGQDRTGQERTGEEPGASAPVFSQGVRITSDTPLPPALQHEWDTLLGILYPEPVVIVKGRDRAVGLFARSAERQRIIRNAHHLAATDAWRRGYRISLDKYVAGAYRDYDAPSTSKDGPTGAGPPIPDRSWKAEADADMEKFRQELAAGKKRPKLLEIVGARRAVPGKNSEAE